MAEVLAPILNFALVLAVFFFAGRKGFLAMLSGRAHSVEKEMSEAETAFGRASKSLSESESNHRNREANAKREMDEAKANSMRHRVKAVTAATNEAERIKREAKLMGTNEVENAKLGLQRELAEKSLEMASVYLDKHLDPKDKGKLVSEYVELVGHSPLVSGGA